MPTVVYHAGRVVERKKGDPVEINWAADPDPADFPAARSFLGLVMPDEYADRAVELLRAAPATRARAKDIVRGSAGELAPEKLPGVQDEMKKMEDGEPITPLLLVQGGSNTQPDMLIADGWHRAHAAYYLQHDAWVPVRVAKGVFDV